MNRKFLFLTGAVALLIALFALGSGNGAHAQQPFSMNFDIVMCDGVGGGNPAPCSNAGSTTGAIGAPDGIIQAGENPEVKTNLTLDLSPLVVDENIFGLANTVWNGITPRAGSAITDGDRAGEISFSIESNLTSPGTSNVNVLTGQPSKCLPPGGVSTLTDTLFLYDAELATSPTVSIRDQDSDGLAEEFEDNMLANGSAGSNGLMDGIDVMPDALATTTIPNMGLGNPISRAFGKATVSSTLGVEATINFVVFDLRTNPDIQGYLSVTVLNYPGLPAAMPEAAGITGQTVVTCPPFVSNVRIFGKNLGNTTSTPTITAGTVNRTAVAGGPYDYRIDLSSGDNYDGDTAAQDFDTCEKAVSVNTDLTGGPDPDNDRWATACDVLPLTGDNAGGAARSDNIPGLPPSWPMDPNQCNVAYLPALTGGWDCDQDVDGDGTLNTQDNCPLATDYDRDVDNADLDGNPLTGVDWQYDQDSDGVGNVCDPAPTIKGDGTGYAGTYEDYDDKCIDVFSIPGSEPVDASPNGFCIGAGADGVYGSGPEGRHWNDSDDDGDPDWDDANSSGTYQLGELIDTDDDTDKDNQSDACEAVKGSDALDAASKPAGPPPTLDCDAGTAKDSWEEAALNKGAPSGDFLNPADDSVDTDGDGCANAEESQPNKALGGTRNWNNIKDFYDITNISGVIGTRDKGVSGFDLNMLLAWGGAVDNGPPNPGGKDYDNDGNLNTIEDGLEMDFASIAGPGTGPDGGISGFDLNQMLAEGGSSCVGAP